MMGNCQLTASTGHLLFIPLGFAPPGRRMRLAGGCAHQWVWMWVQLCPCPTVLAVQNPARPSLCSCALVCTLQIQLFYQVFLPFPGSRAALPDWAVHQVWALHCPATHSHSQQSFPGNTELDPQ